MPHKINGCRRHKMPKAEYRVANWPDYDAALVRRGSLTVWVTNEAIAAWHAPANGMRGGQRVYSDSAISLGMFFMHQRLRRVRERGWGGVIRMSHSHRPEAPDYRVVLPLTEEIELDVPAPE